MLGERRIKAGLVWGGTISLPAYAGVPDELTRNIALADNRDAK